MSTKASAAALIQAVKELKLDWDRTQVYWQDTKAMQFERDYIEAIPDLMLRSTNIIQDIDALLKKVHNDCE